MRANLSMYASLLLLRLAVAAPDAGAQPGSQSCASAESSEQEGCAAPSLLQLGQGKLKADLADSASATEMDSLAAASGDQLAAAVDTAAAEAVEAAAALSKSIGKSMQGKKGAKKKRKKGKKGKKGKNKNMRGKKGKKGKKHAPEVPDLEGVLMEMQEKFESSSKKEEVCRRTKTVFVFLLDPTEAWTIDLKHSCKISKSYDNPFATPDCKISIKDGDFLDLLNKKVSGESLSMSGKMKLSSMTACKKLGDALTSALAS